MSSKPTNKPRRKVAVVGSGIAGLSAAWALHNSKSYEVHIYEEASDHLGGHTNRVPFSHSSGKRINVDTGFVILNAETYPNFLALLDHLHVKTEPTETSFSVTDRASGLSYSNSTLSTLFSQPANLTSPRFYRLLFDIARFNLFAPDLLNDTSVPDSITLSTYLSHHHYTAYFATSYLLPLLASIRRTPASPLPLPAKPLIRFLTTHNILSPFPCHPAPWLSLQNGASAYITALTQHIPGFQIHLSTPVTAIGNRGGKPYLKITDPDDASRAEFETSYDHIIVATAGDEALKLLVSPTEMEREVLGAFTTSTTRAVLHADPACLPPDSTMWAAANTRANTLTYNMNLLQHIPRSVFGDVLVTVNPLPGCSPRKSSIKAEFAYRHAVVSADAEYAKGRLEELQRERPGVMYAGAWIGDGVHEDACRTGLRAAERLGVTIPWGPVVDTVTYQRGWVGVGGVVMAALRWVCWWFAGVMWVLDLVWMLVGDVVGEGGKGKKKL